MVLPSSMFQVLSTTEFGMDWTSVTVVNVGRSLAMALRSLNIKEDVLEKGCCGYYKCGKAFLANAQCWLCRRTQTVDKAYPCNEYRAFGKCADLTRYQRINNEHEPYEENACERPSPRPRLQPRCSERICGRGKSCGWGHCRQSFRQRSAPNLTQFTQERKPLGAVSVVKPLRDIGNSYVK